MVPKPPLELSRSESPLPGLNARNYDPPVPPIGPFAVGRALYQAQAAAGGAGSLLGAGIPQFGPTPVPVIVGPAFNWSQTENYLILGTDHRPGWTNWRTDVVMVVGVDRANNRAAVFSIPRDLYVQIPGYGWGRINQVDYLGERANPGGGPALVSQVLEKTLGISTNHWVRVRMDGFIDLVNAVGGVTVHLDCPFYEPIFNLSTNSWDYFALPPGDVWLDGDMAYWFVRLRYRESDIGRNQRQREFLWALRNQVVQTNLLIRFPQLYAAFQNMLTTDMNPFEILDMLTWGIQLDAANVRASGLALADLQSYTTPQGASVLRIGDPTRVRAAVEGIWAAPAMVDSYRKDTRSCQPLPAGVTYSTDSSGLDASNVDLDVELPPPPENVTPPENVATPPEEATSPPEVIDGPAALPTPTPTPAQSASSSLFPTPTPAPVGLLPVGDGGG